MFPKYASAVSSATAATLGLFYVMQLLITMPVVTAAAPRVRGTLDWTRVRPAEHPPRTNDRIPDKNFIEPPILPDTRLTSDGDGYTPVAPYTPTAPLTETPGFNVVPDGPLVTIMCVEPHYPEQALSAGLEGTVLVESDIAANGSVTDARVIESSGRVFEKAALEAARRFRYKPRVVDGVPMPASGVRYLFRFELAN